MLRVLFICSGNSCRSPMAEAAFRHLLAADGLDRRIEVDSAGTACHQPGAPPHPNTLAVLAAAGISVQGLSARQLIPGDFDHFDWLVAVDERNLELLRRLGQPRPGQHFCLLSDFGGLAWTGGPSMPDPIYSGDYDLTYRLAKAACQGLLERLKIALRQQ